MLLRLSGCAIRKIQLQQNGRQIMANDLVVNVTAGGKRDLTAFVPQEARAKLAIADAKVMVAVKAKNPDAIERAAFEKAGEIFDLVTWWDSVVQSVGGDRQSKALTAPPVNGLAVSEAEQECQFRQQRIAEYRKQLGPEKSISDLAAHLTLKMMTAAGLIERLKVVDVTPPKTTKPAAAPDDDYEDDDITDAVFEELSDKDIEVVAPGDHKQANQARRIVEAMGFENLRVFDAWYMPHRTALIGPTDEVLALRAEVASLKLEITNLKLASETQSPLPTPRLKKERDRSDPSPDEEAATKLWQSYLDMPNKSIWFAQQFDAIKMGLPLALKGQGDASFQVVRDYEAASKEVRALFDIKLKTQQSDKKHKGDDF
jgi:hypothetical protein